MGGVAAVEGRSRRERTQHSMVQGGQAAENKLEKLAAMKVAAPLLTREGSVVRGGAVLEAIEPANC